MNKSTFEIYGKFSHKMIFGNEYFKMDIIEFNPEKDSRDLIAFNVINMATNFLYKESAIKTLIASITELISAYYDELENLKETKQC